MSRRGFVGFVIDGVEKIAYNHNGSDPEVLGADVLDWLKTVDLVEARESARVLRTVAQDSEPSDEDIERLKEFLDPNVGGVHERPDWYQLLRHTQGRPAAMLEAGVIEDASGFPQDSLFAEWGYVVDFDAWNFEVYRGFQRHRHEMGRFANRPGKGDYFPVRLIKTWPFEELPDDKDFIAAIFNTETDEKR